MDFNSLQADVNKLLSVHYTPGRGGNGISKIVLHHNAGNLTVEDCYRVWQTREASAHYQVETGGRIGQLVNDWDTAWHAGDWTANQTSIGIEHANDGGAGWTISDKCLDSGAHLVAALCRYYNLGRPEWLKNVFPHSYFQATACPGAIYGSQKAEYMKRAQQWYDAMGGGASAPSAPASPAPKPSKPAGKVTIRYGLRVLGGGWLDEVTDFGSGSEGFAGLPFSKHDYLYAKVDRGQLRYRAHTREDGWLDWVYKGDKADTVNGCAGIAGHAIDGVQAYYTTPSGEEYQQVWYRSQTTERAGWLPVCCDDGTSVAGYDGWAGMYGEPLDRLQMAIGTRNPF